jgi:hypothetical protein
MKAGDEAGTFKEGRKEERDGGRFHSIMIAQGYLQGRKEGRKEGMEGGSSQL